MFWFFSDLRLSDPLQDSGDLATDFSVAKSKKSVSKSFSNGFATEKNSVGKTLVVKLSDGNLQSVAKLSDGNLQSVAKFSEGF